MIVKYVNTYIIIMKIMKITKNEDIFFVCKMWRKHWTFVCYKKTNVSLLFFSDVKINQL